MQRRVERRDGEIVGIAEGVEHCPGDECVADTAGGELEGGVGVLGPVGATGYVAYTASKGAVIAMTNVAALEHAPDHIRVNAICPGPVRTPMSEAEGDASVDITPLRRRAEPEEISSAVAFLASDDAVYITGTELAVDGGYLAR